MKATDRKSALSHERLCRLFDYNPNTGLFVRKTCAPGRNRKIGVIAGYTRKDGYRGIRIDGREYLQHRLAVFFMTGSWPAEEVDHRDGDRGNNRWGNLRAVSCGDNRKNKARYRGSSRRHVGVEVRESGKWRARIKVNGKEIHLGTFDSESTAHEVRVAAEIEFFGEFRRKVS